LFIGQSFSASVHEWKHGKFQKFSLFKGGFASKTVAAKTVGLDLVTLVCANLWVPVFSDLEELSTKVTKKGRLNEL